MHPRVSLRLLTLPLCHGGGGVYVNKKSWLSSSFHFDTSDPARRRLPVTDTSQGDSPRIIWAFDKKWIICMIHLGLHTSHAVITNLQEFFRSLVSTHFISWNVLKHRWLDKPLFWRSVCNKITTRGDFARWEQCVCVCVCVFIPLCPAVTEDTFMSLLEASGHMCGAVLHSGAEISILSWFNTHTHTHTFVQLSLWGLYIDFHSFVRPNANPYPNTNLNQF